MTQGYTGRKLDEYTWIPKSKTYLKEYREFLKICDDVERENHFFNDRLVGEEMVKRRAIVDRDSTAESYVEKYENQSVGNQSYVSNARMMIRICRWLGWMTKIKGLSRFALTPYGKNLTWFSGEYPSKIGKIDESDLMKQAFAKMKFYSANDSSQYRNYKFHQRIFLNMLYVLSQFQYCSHYELVVSAFVLKGESETELKIAIDTIKKLKAGELTIGQALAKFGLDCNNKSRVTGVYDGPKVLLSFARQFGFVEKIQIDKDIDKPTYLIYEKMYKNSGHIKTNGIKSISKLTALGHKFVEENINKVPIWFDDLKEKPEEASILIYLEKSHNSLSKSCLQGSGYERAIYNLIKAGLIKCSGDIINLAKEIDFDLYQDVNYEYRDKVITLLNGIEDDFIGRYSINMESEQIKEKVGDKTWAYGECFYCLSPPCKEYPSITVTYGASDRFPDRVCPIEAIQKNSLGEIKIESDKCIGCMLCINRCPFSAIKMNSGKISLDLSKSFILVSTKEKQFITETNIKKNGKTILVDLKEIANIIKLFEKKITAPGNAVKKDVFYVCVRNYFRGLGFEAVYSGSGGMKTRSDVTLLNPYLITSEVKSPAEGPINLKAVRQAVDAAIQKGNTLTFAIGQTTHQGAIEQELKYRKATAIKICLLEIKYLLFLYLVRKLIFEDAKISTKTINDFMEANPGYFDNKKLKDLLEQAIKLQKNLDSKTIKELFKQASLI